MQIIINAACREVSKEPLLSIEWEAGWARKPVWTFWRK
jgi:hypothetical protein